MASEKTNRRSQVLIGKLPDNFLRVGSPRMIDSIVNSTNNSQIMADQQTAAMLQSQISCKAYQPSTHRLTINVVQATLVKNYGLTKMDPYVRVLVGNSVIETHTAQSGGKNPIWNKTFQLSLPKNVDSIYLEIFDERSFTLDDKIAWAQIIIPERIFKGEVVVDDWYSLSGKQGLQKEGSINVIFSYAKVQISPYHQIMYTVPGLGLTYPMNYPQQLVMVPQTGIPYYTAPGSYPVNPAQMMYPMRNAAPYTQPNSSKILCNPNPNKNTSQSTTAATAMSNSNLPASNLSNNNNLINNPQNNDLINSTNNRLISNAGHQYVVLEEDVTALNEMFPLLEKSVIAAVLLSHSGNKEHSVNELLSMNTAQ